ncbi:lipopolysaccharide heptosyltransferase II [Geomesophilobacter sediminis]|uniref:lipopolysaccharide heptosyltransferase II n=1 Tax=Geomesophilobacter sediminis TaxID=2798584 RepID=A0A8J7M0M4_9BACT|nr:lipopolysaccharide heptosyltransferase II [Geomesophilobacter sediminis]MBJ6725952.1 lipopolysaccharide heptosyltransferase II [Geomesophilobacter sediminis]
MGRKIDIEKIRRVVVRVPNWLGDAVMATPILGAVRASFPKARIAVLATPLPAQLFTTHPAVDEVLVYDKKGTHAGIGGRLKLIQELCSRSFDLAILFPNSVDAALVPLLAGVRRRMGTGHQGRGLLLTHTYDDAPMRETRLHQVENDLRRVGQFGIAGGSGKLELATTAAEDAAIAELLADAGIAPGEFVLGVNPGATYGSAKRWYPDRFAAAAAELGAAWGAKVVITGSPAEAPMAAEIAALLPGAVNLAGKTDVRGLMALIKRCNFFITNDSGPMHIAAAFGVPLVAVFGPTDNSATSPYTPDAIMVRKPVDCAPCMLRECPTDHRCMTEVTAADVVEAAQRLWRQVSGKQ